MIGVGLTAFGALLAIDHKMAKMIEKTQASVVGLKFKDTIGIPFTKDWRARLALTIAVYNPTDMKFPLTIERITPIINGKPVAAYSSGDKDIVIFPGVNTISDLYFSIPITAENIQQIRNLNNPAVTVKARVAQLPINFTYNFS